MVERNFIPSLFLLDGERGRGGVGISGDRILIGMKCAEIDSYRAGIFFLRKTRKRLHPIKAVVGSSLLIVDVDININDSTVIISSNEY